MNVRVTVTGSGTPIMRPGVAGPGVLVEANGLAFQFDVGRGTTMRLTDLGLSLGDLDALFITHHHSDHLVGLADLLMSRWIEGYGDALPVVAPQGEATKIAAGVLDIWRSEIEMRQAMTHYAGDPAPAIRAFSPTGSLQPVLQEGGVAVSAISVAHEPVLPAVGYRIEAAGGIVAVSGDTAVCPALIELAREADVFVCEAFRAAGTADLLSDPAAIAAYHADSIEVGRVALQAGVGTLMLTHLIPPVESPNDKAAFVADIRAGGFTGPVVVASDLDQITI